MATASMISMTISETGVPVVVPDNDLARLMYYLNCVTLGLGLDLLQDDIVNYKNYRQLSRARTEQVYRSALLFSPDELIDKLIFRDDDLMVAKTSSNKFCSVSVACDVVSLQRDVLVAGKMQNVTRVMFFKSSWLEKYYTDPLLSFLVDSMVTAAITSPPPSSAPPPPQSSNLHRCRCDWCGVQNFQGTGPRPLCLPPARQPQ